MRFTKAILLLALAAIVSGTVAPAFAQRDTRPEPDRAHPDSDSSTQIGEPFNPFDKELESDNGATDTDPSAFKVKCWAEIKPPDDYVQIYLKNGGSTIPAGSIITINYKDGSFQAFTVDWDIETGGIVVHMAGPKSALDPDFSCWITVTPKPDDKPRVPKLKPAAQLPGPI